MFRRLVPLWPIGIFLASLLAADQLLLWLWRPSIDHLPREEKAWIQKYRAFRTSLADSRPRVIVVGSSRAREAVSDERLQAAIDSAGLPYRAVNLSIGGGGTPALIYSALKDLGGAEDRLPKGTVIVYLFSRFEMNFLRPQYMRLLPTGEALLGEFGYINQTHGLRLLRAYSGFARFAIGQGWKGIPANSFVAVQASSLRPLTILPIVRQCNGAGLENYKVLPINEVALRRLAELAKHRLLLVDVPTSSKQRRIDRTYNVNYRSEDLIAELNGAGVLRYIQSFDLEFGITDDDFPNDCDHIGTEAGHRKVAAQIIRLLKKLD